MKGPQRSPYQRLVQFPCEHCTVYTSVQYTPSPRPADKWIRALSIKILWAGGTILRGLYLSVWNVNYLFTLIKKGCIICFIFKTKVLLVLLKQMISTKAMCHCLVFLVKLTVDRYYS